MESVETPIDKPRILSDVVIMSKQYYMSLYRGITLLQLLEAHGISNWEGHAEVMKEYRENLYGQAK